MNKAKLILKGVLLWATFFAAAIFVLGIDSIIESGYILQILIACVSLCYACYRLISEEEFEIITFSKWLDNKLRSE